MAIGRDLQSAAGEQLRLMGYFRVTAKLLNVDLHLLAIYFPRVGTPAYFVQ